MKRTIWPHVRPWLGLLAALLVLNAAVTFHNVWPTPWITLRPELSIEIALLVLALAWLSERVARPPRVLLHVVTALLLVLCVGRYAEVTAPALYGRAVNFYWDAQHLPRVAAMLVEVASPWLVAVLALAFALALGALTALLHWSAARVWDALHRPKRRRVIGAAAAAIVGLYAAATLLDASPRHWFSLPVSATYRQQAQFMLEAHAEQAAAESPIAPLASSDLQRVAGADVLLLFLESYGAVAFDSPQIAAAVAPARAALEAAAANSGWHTLSAFVQSPTFGGASWLAHATLLSGFEVTTTPAYNLLLTQDRQTLASLFTAAGYRSIAWMPGLRKPWPEGTFYGFDAIYGERELDYRGPAFGWWRIPDQYALAKLDAAELDGAGPLRFVFFPTINTHVPFRPTPPLQPDWPKLLSGAPYDEHATAQSLAVQPEWTNLAPAYADTLAYTFSYLASYLQERADRDFVLVIVGDHQPAASVSGQGARWDVPVHVITRRNDLAAAFLDEGFTDGIELPSGGAPVGRLTDLTAMLLAAFNAGPAAPGGYGATRETAR
jgi:phosphoglycerol transferase MdoB-like AlkP superfamily enzyme